MSAAPTTAEPALRMTQPEPARGRRRWLLAAIPVVAIAALLAPMVLTDSTFGIDWSGHLWLVSMQQRNIEALGHPSFFVQSALGSFYAWFAFYGGTLYSLAGGLAALVGGHTTAAYVAFFGLAFTMSYGGCWWLSRQCGIRGWQVHLVPLLAVTSAYLLTDAYARGAWPETMAVSSLPLVLAAAGSVLRGRRVHPLAALTLVGACTILTGSHNITLLVSTMFLIVLGAIAWFAGVDPRSLPRSRVLAVFGLLGLALALNLWFLLPDLAYGKRTFIGAHPTPPYMPNLTLDIVLDPLRTSLLGTSPQLGHTPTFDTQLPTLAFVWATVALLACRRQLGRGARRLSAALVALVVVLVFLIVTPGVWPHLPKLVWNIQFPYRLESYVTFCVLGLVLVALSHISRAPRRRALLGALVAIVVLEFGQALNQIWSTPSTLPSRSQIYSLGPEWWIRFASAGETTFGNEFGDYYERTVTPSTTQKLVIPAKGPVKRAYTLTYVSPGPGSIETNMQTGWYLVSVKGAHPDGRVEDDSLVVSENVPKGQTGHVTFEPSSSKAVVLGRVFSIAGLLALLGLVVWAVVDGIASLRRRFAS
jgi:uncharacterized membrane protein